MSIDLSKFRKHQKSRGRAIPTEPIVQVGKTGVIMINDPAWKLFGDDEPPALALLFNDEERVIALQASSSNDPDAFRVHKAGHRHQLNARRFMQEVGVNLEEARLGTPAFDTAAKALYFAIESSAT